MFVTQKAGTHICLSAHTLFSLSVSCFCGMVIVGIHRVLGNMFVVDRD